MILCFARQRENIYLHKISSIKNGVSYQISNNHKHVNGTIGRSNIYGLVTNF